MTRFRRKHPSADYDSQEFEGQLKRKLRQSLLAEQKFVCAYCCCEIDIDHSMNEHVEPRKLKGGRRSRRSLDYGNLVASCMGDKGESTCGAHKGNEYREEMFVSPLDPECENRFKYYADGMIEGTDEKGMYTIDLLNLKSYQLQSARKAVYRQLLDMTNGCTPDEMKEIIQMCFGNGEEEKLQPFYNVVKWFVKNEID